MSEAKDPVSVVTQTTKQSGILTGILVILGLALLLSLFMNAYLFYHLANLKVTTDTESLPAGSQPGDMDPNGSYNEEPDPNGGHSTDTTKSEITMDILTFLTFKPEYRISATIDPYIKMNPAEEDKDFRPSLSTDDFELEFSSYYGGSEGGYDEYVEIKGNKNYENFYRVEGRDTAPVTYYYTNQSIKKTGVCINEEDVEIDAPCGLPFISLVNPKTKTNYVILASCVIKPDGDGEKAVEMCDEVMKTVSIEAL